MMAKMKSIVNTLEANSVSKVKAIVNSLENQSLSSSFSGQTPSNKSRTAALEEARSVARFAKVNARRKLDLVCENNEDDDKENQSKGKKKRKTKVGNQTVTINTFGEDCDLDLEKQC